MERPIVGYHCDEQGDWVAELGCGHGQHVRHDPPFWPRPWAVDVQGRTSRLDTPLDCPLCDRAELPVGLQTQRTEDQGGESACWAHLLCLDCGAVLDGGAHLRGCRSTIG